MLDGQGLLNIWHPDGQTSIAAQVDGVWEFTETQAERDAYEIAALTTQLSMPIDQTYSWGDEAHTALNNQAGSLVAQKGPTGEWVYLGEPVVMSSLDIDFNGRLIPFSIETATGTADARLFWREELGIESLVINPNLVDAEEKLGNLFLMLCFAASDASVFDNQTGFVVRFADYKKDPDAYPVNRMPGAVDFLPSAVMRIRIVYVDWYKLDPWIRVLTGNEGARTPFSFMNGTLTFYSATSPEDDDMRRLTSPESIYDQYRGRGLEQVVGEFLQRIIRTATILPYYVPRRLDALQNIIHYTPDCGPSDSACYITFARYNFFWAATFTPDE